MPPEHIVIVGTAAAGINMAQALGHANIPTTLIESDPDAAERAAFFLRRSQIGQATIPDFITDLSPVRSATLVVEALYADADARAELRATLADMIDPSIPLAALGIEPCNLADSASRLIGLNLMAPAHMRRLVEVAPGPMATPQAVNRLRGILRKSHRIPVAAPPGKDSAGTRLRRRLVETADTLLMDGAIPFELDEAMVAFGFDLGVYETEDLIGLDVGYADRKRNRKLGRRYIPIADRMVEEGRLGQKVGVGWYRYPGGGGAVIDPLVEDLIREEARFAGVEPRPFTAEEMMQKLLLSLVHEGALMLADGTVASAAEIDRILIHGFGFPRSASGAMAWADARGLGRTLQDLAALTETDPVTWPPSPLIADCRRIGLPLARWVAPARP